MPQILTWKAESANETVATAPSATLPGDLTISETRIKSIPENVNGPHRGENERITLQQSAKRRLKEKVE
jgi:hypothetical protein